MKQALHALIFVLLCTTISFAQTNCTGVIMPTIDIGPPITLCDNEPTDLAVVTTSSNLPTLEYIIVDLNQTALDGLGPAIIGIDDDGEFLPADLGITGPANIAVIPIAYNIQDFHTVIDAAVNNMHLGKPCCAFVDAIYPNFCATLIIKDLANPNNITGIADITGILDLIQLTNGKDSVEGLVFKIILLENLIKAIPDECLEPMSVCYAISPTRQVYTINETPTINDVSETAPGQITVDASLSGSGTLEYSLDPNGPFQSSNVFDNVPPVGLVYVRTLGSQCSVAFPYQTASLAVELDAFKVTALSTTNLISWTTLTETNNEGFSLYRADDGVNFEKIAWIEGAINSTTLKEYEYHDSAPLFGKNYYSISMEDIGGSTTFSDVVVVSREETEDRFNVLAVQNPVANDMLQVTFANNTTGTFDYIIYDVSGKTIAKGTDTVLEGINNFMLDVSQLNPSVYFFTATKDGFNVSERFMINY